MKNRFPSCDFLINVNVIHRLAIAIAPRTIKDSATHLLQAEQKMLCIMWWVWVLLEVCWWPMDRWKLRKCVHEIIWSEKQVSRKITVNPMCTRLCKILKIKRKSLLEWKQTAKTMKIRRKEGFRNIPSYCCTLQCNIYYSFSTSIVYLSTFLSINRLHY